MIATNMIKKYFLLLTLSCLISCADTSKDSFETGKNAYDSGKFDRAKKYFLKVDSTSQWSGPAIAYIRKIDSLSTISSTLQTPSKEITRVNEYFTEDNLQLDTSQFQLIDQTCALFLKTPAERRRQSERYAAIEDSIKEATQRYDSSERSDEDEEVLNDDGMWYQYKYEEQFETLKELDIPKVRVQNKLHVRFIDRNKKVWTLVNKEGVFYDDGIVLFNVNKRPMHLYLTDFGSDEIRRYFSKK